MSLSRLERGKLGIKVDARTADNVSFITDIGALTATDPRTTLTSMPLVRSKGRKLEIQADGTVSVVCQV